MPERKIISKIAFFPDLNLTWIMTKYLFILFFFLYFNCDAQSYLGKTRKEIYKLAETDLADAKLSFNVNADGTFIKAINDYETLYYYLEDDICVRFEVYKPYTCNCLETDVQAYNMNLISDGDHKWISRDYARIYEMTLYGTNYRLSVTPNHKPAENSLSSNKE